MKVSILRTIALGGFIFFPCSLLAQQNGRASDLPSAEAAVASASVRKSGDNDSVLLGKKLRTEIDKAYQQALDTGGLKDGIDLNPIVVTYIRIGMSFDDAENILRAAGFKIDPRPEPGNSTNSWVNSRQDRFDVVGEIDPYSQNYMSKVAVYVHLTPKAPYAYGTVEKIQSFLTQSTP